MPLVKSNRETGLKTRNFLLLPCLMAATLWALPAGAVEYKYGEVSGSADTILSAGASMRTSERDCANIGKSGGGCQKYDASSLDKAFAGANGDDGNLNYDQWDVFSGAMKATSEVQANWRNFSAFVRGSAFYDPLVMDTDFRDLESPQASEVERNAKLYDYFVTGSFDVGTLPLEIKLGNQVISWGESTFIQNGLSLINPIDVAAVRKPGSELKEFFTPILAARASMGLPNNFSFDAFYQFKSDNIVPDPSGTFFSTVDMIGRGSQPIRAGISDFGDDARFNPFIIARGLSADTLWETNAVGLPFTRSRPLGVNSPSVSIERANDKNADNGGEFGFALRYFAAELNQGTEFGLFAMNLHSRLPILELSTTVPQQAFDFTGGTNIGQLATLTGAAPAGGARNAFEVGQAFCNAIAAGTAAGGLAHLLTFNGIGSASTPFRVLGALGAGPDLSGPAGVPDGVVNALDDQPANIGAAQLALPGGYRNCNNMARLLDGNVAGVERTVGALLGNTQRFRLEYPEDIQVFGFSASTTIGPLAVQGEMTYRHDQPFNYAFAEMGALANDLDGQTRFRTKAPQAGGLVPLAGGAPLPIPGITQTIADPQVLFEARDVVVGHLVAASAGQPTFATVVAAENANPANAATAAFAAALGLPFVPVTFTPALVPAGPVLAGVAALNTAAANAAVPAGIFVPISALLVPAFLGAGVPAGAILAGAVPATDAAGRPLPAVALGTPASTAFAPLVGVAGVAPQTRSSAIPLSAVTSDGFIKPAEADVFTAQTTLTSVLFASNPVVQFAGADQGVIVTEGGMVMIPGISSADGLQGGNTRGLVNSLAAQSYRLNNDMELGGGYGTKFSWGLQGLVQLTYNRAFGSPVNLSPSVAWKWDMGGNTPAPFGNYQAERKAITLGVNGSYLASWSGALNWTSNFGPDAPLADRDFASFTISYAF